MLLANLKVLSMNLLNHLKKDKILIAYYLYWLFAIIVFGYFYFNPPPKG